MEDTAALTQLVEQANQAEAAANQLVNEINQQEARLDQLRASLVTAVAQFEAAKTKVTERLGSLLDWALPKEIAETLATQPAPSKIAPLKQVVVDPAPERPALRKSS